MLDETDAQVTSRDSCDVSCACSQPDSSLNYVCYLGGLIVWHVDVEKKDRVRYLSTGTSIPKVGPRDSQNLEEYIVPLPPSSSRKIYVMTSSYHVFYTGSFLTS